MAFKENSDPIKDMDIGIISFDSYFGTPVEKLRKIYDMICNGDTDRIRYKGKILTKYTKKELKEIYNNISLSLAFSSSWDHKVSAPYSTGQIIPGRIQSTNDGGITIE